MFSSPPPSQGLPLRFRSVSALLSRRLSPLGLSFVSSGRASLEGPFGRFRLTVLRASRPISPFSRTHVPSFRLPCCLSILPDTPPALRPASPLSPPGAFYSVPVSRNFIRRFSFPFVLTVLFALNGTSLHRPPRFHALAFPRDVGLLFACPVLFPQRCGFPRFRASHFSYSLSFVRLRAASARDPL